MLVDQIKDLQIFRPKCDDLDKHEEEAARAVSLRHLPQIGLER
jgi:hypothetical protein